MYDKDGRLLDRREMLRVKVKSLAAEAQIIRREEQRTWGGLRDELHNHRVVQLRQEARVTHLVYGLICGRTLAQMEPRNREGRSVKDCLWLQERVNKMLKKYGPVGAVIALPELKKAA